MASPRAFPSPLMGRQMVPMMRPSPLLGPRFPSSGPSTLPQDQRQQLLQAFNAHPAVADLRRWLNEAPNIMAQTGNTGILTYTLGTQDTISCVAWRGKHFITGTDIVKILRFRFACIGKPIGNVKKFEEGVFSDLRNLKAGEHASLEEPKSEFLEFLYKHNCIRTQKKQKVFYWFEVRHDDLVLEAFERDAKRHNQQANINHFLRNQGQQTPFMPGAGLGASPRLMPRGQGVVPFFQSQQHQQQQMMYGSQLFSPAAAPMSPAMAQYMVSSAAVPEFDPALDFINDLPLESHLYEPLPKSPRISGGPALASQGTAIDPSLISALPAKAQRKVRQQVECRSTPAGSKARELALPAVQEELKDPLLGDPFSFGVDSGLGLGNLDSIHGYFFADAFEPNTVDDATDFQF